MHNNIRVIYVLIQFLEKYLFQDMYCLMRRAFLILLSFNLLVHLHHISLHYPLHYTFHIWSLHKISQFHHFPYNLYLYPIEPHSLHLLQPLMPQSVPIHIFLELQSLLLPFPLHYQPLHLLHSLLSLVIQIFNLKICKFSFHFLL